MTTDQVDARQLLATSLVTGLDHVGIAVTDLDAAIEWYHQRLLNGSDAAAARGYLRRERGYDGDVVRLYKLGWAPEGWDQLVRSLGLPAPALVDAGLATVDESGRFTDFFRGRFVSVRQLGEDLRVEVAA